MRVDIYPLESEISSAVMDALVTRCLPQNAGTRALTLVMSALVDGKTVHYCIRYTRPTSYTRVVVYRSTGDEQLLMGRNNTRAPTSIPADSAMVVQSRFGGHFAFAKRGFLGRLFLAPKRLGRVEEDAEGNPISVPGTVLAHLYHSSGWRGMGMSLGWIFPDAQKVTKVCFHGASITGQLPHDNALRDKVRYGNYTSEAQDQKSSISLIKAIAVLAPLCCADSRVTVEISYELDHRGRSVDICNSMGYNKLTATVPLVFDARGRLVALGKERVPAQSLTASLFVQDDIINRAAAETQVPDVAECDLVARSLYLRSFECDSVNSIPDYIPEVFRGYDDEYSYYDDE